LALSDDLDFENLNDHNLDYSNDDDFTNSSACASISMEGSTATQSCKEMNGSNTNAASTAVAVVATTLKLSNNTHHKRMLSVTATSSSKKGGKTQSICSDELNRFFSSGARRQ
jgi:hypothetical protein